MENALFDRETFKNLASDFKIGAIVSDGMWWSKEKWAKNAYVSVAEIEEWIEREMATGRLVQSETGARSFRFPYESILEWYEENDLKLGVQLVDFLFPPRIWNGMTEVEGFLDAPLREIGGVTFSCSTQVVEVVKTRLRGIAKIREIETGQYKAYCLSSGYVKTIIESVFEEFPDIETGRIHSRLVSKRREMIDFPEEFSRNLVMFYKEFGKTLAKGGNETIRIYLPEVEDQESQITYWVVLAIEKFNEKSSVPFSGYLDAVLKKRPYDLPGMYLGRDLSDFQRGRNRAVKKLRKDRGVENPEHNFSSADLAEAMGIERSSFDELEEKHRTWKAAKLADSLTWGDSSDEKLSRSISDIAGASSGTDKDLAHQISVNALESALETDQYEDALSLICQIDSWTMDIDRSRLSPEFLDDFGRRMGLQAKER